MTDLQKQYDETKAQLEKLGEMLKVEKEGAWKPRDGDRYYWVLYDGGVATATWGSSVSELKMLEVDNVFPTIEAARLEVKKRKVLKKLKDLAGGFKPDWSDGYEDRYQIYYNHRSEAWYFSSWSVSQWVSGIYFPTQEAARNAIDTLGYELNVLLEG